MYSLPVKPYPLKETALLTKPKVYFINLNGLRTIAFLFVYLQHAFLPAFFLLNIKYDFLNRLIRTVANGGYGVSIFFVISGFLITYLILLEIEYSGRLNVGFFYIRRILRIWPLYYLIIIFVFVLYPHFKESIGIYSHISARLPFYFTFLGNFDIIHVEKYFRGNDSMSGNVTWSLAVEEQFYLVWPLLFYFLNKKAFKWVFLIIILVSAIFRILNLHDEIVNYFHSLSVCSDLAIGGLFAYFSLYSRKFALQLNKLSKLTIIIFYVIGTIWILYGDKVMNELLYTFFGRIFNAIFFAFIIVEQNYSCNSFYKLSRFKFLTNWGKYTYGLYLIHPISILLFDIALRLLHIQYKNSFILVLLVAFGGLFFSGLLSYLSYNYYEKSFLKLKDRFSIIPSILIKKASLKTKVQKVTINH
jgi:peptidoglycan/LPS O-acetylase OafA/YrhL